MSGSDAHLPLGDASRTISIWVKFTSIGNDAIWMYGTTQVADQMLVLLINSTTSIRVSSFVYNWDITVPTLTTGTWYHMVVTYDTTTNNFYFYLNGTKYGPNNHTINTVSSGLQIPWTTYSQWPAAYFDDFAVYDVVLSDEQISLIYNSGTGRAISAVYNGEWTITDGGLDIDPGVTTTTNLYYGASLSGTTLVDAVGSLNFTASAGTPTVDSGDYPSSNMRIAQTASILYAPSTRSVTATPIMGGMPSTNWGVELWTKKAGAPVSNHYILAQAVTGFSCLLLYANGTNLIGGTWDGAAFFGVTVAQATYLPDGVWKHIAIIYNGTTLSMYVDGVSVGTPATGTMDDTNQTVCWLGSNGGTSYMNGNVMQLRFFTTDGTFDPNTDLAFWKP